MCVRGVEPAAAGPAPPALPASSGCGSDRIGCIGCIGLQYSHIYYLRPPKIAKSGRTSVGACHSSPHARRIANLI
eukprot:5829386-Prymnesium_polylepis.2